MALTRRKIIQWTLAVFTALYTLIVAAAIPVTSDNPRTFLGPSARLTITKAINDDTAFSLLGEAGRRNLRIGGTLGWQIDDNNRFKASAELLRQKITYTFFDGQENPWLNQGAIGAQYLYDFQQYSPYDTQIVLNAYYSQAPSVTLGSTSGSYIQNGVVNYYSLNKRIAGSKAGGVGPGINIIPWVGTTFGLELNYDYVSYDTKYRGEPNVKGFGGTAHWDQALGDNLSFGLAGAVRKPFNTYHANISFDSIPFYGSWIVSVFGDYTAGKSSLPSTYNFGVSFDYLFDAREQIPLPARTVPLRNYKDMPVYKDRPIYKDAPQLALPVEWEDVEAVNKNFLKWVKVPAVYMKQVLMIPDQRVSICVPPSLTVPSLPDQLIFFGDFFSFDFGALFAGTNLTFSAINLPDVFTINSTTGVVSGISAQNSDIISTITATNSCGSLSAPVLFVVD